MNDIPIPEIRVGEPTMCGALAVYPLFAERQTLFTDDVDYLLSDEAMAAATCSIEETDIVSKLVVQNTGNKPVLFLEGEEVCGGRQNRALGASVLVGAGSRTTVPVFCVERKRWAGSSPHLTTGSHSPPSLRQILKGGSSGKGQAAVWRLIQAKHRATGTSSKYENMTDVLRSSPEVVKELRQNLKYPEGASGIAVTKSGGMVDIDLLNSPRTLEKLWDRLVVLGLTLDAADLRDSEAHGSDISVQLYKVRDVRWREIPTVGMGAAYRARGDDGTLATALVLDDILVHLSVSAPIEEE